MSKTKIFIVEDEAIVAADLSGKLQQLGYEISGTASDGTRAIELISRLSPDLVLMDVKLEGEMDGIQASESIHRLYDIPVIFLTAHSDAATLARAKITGPAGYIQKPFEEGELAIQIELAIYRHDAGRKIREQHEWFRITLTSIGDAVIAVDAESRINFINPVAESITGWSMKEASGQPVQNVFRIINERTGNIVEDPVSKVLSNRRSVALANNTALVTRDGRNVPIEDSAAPIFNAIGEVIGVVLVFHDVTEKRRAAEAMRDLAHFPGENPNPVMRCTLEGNILYANTPAQHWLESLGWKSGGLLPESIMELVEKAGKSLQTLETEITSSKGATFSVFAVRPEGEKYVNFYCIDVTGRIKIRSALQKAHDDLDKKVRERTAELEWRNRELQEFAYVASHDLQEPLRKIKLFGEMLENELKETLTEQGQDYLLRLHLAADRMQKLVKSLLAYSRTSEKASPFERVDLKSIAEVITRDLLPEEIDLVPVFEIGSLPVIDADPVQMHQLLQNLIANAIHYHKEEQIPVVKISSRILDRTCELIIEDNGIGFDMAYVDKIFLPFERLHPRDKYHGTGMGLAICRKITERHGGKIVVKSKPGEGTAFIITLPMRQTNEPV